MARSYRSKIPRIGNELGLGWYDYGARMLNPTIGRWNGVDALAKDYLAWSPFNHTLGNPIRLVDPDGKKVLNFDQDGNYTGTTKDNWFHNFFVGTKGVVNSDDGGTVRQFRFADPQNDSKSFEDGELTRVVFVEDSEVQRLVGMAGGFDSENKTKNLSWRERYSVIGSEGVGGGKMDFSYTQIRRIYPEASVDPINQPSDMVFLVGDMAHNHMNFGNFLFGAAGRAMGFTFRELEIGAHKNSRFPEDGQGNRLGEDNLNGYSPQWDSSDDQRSILQGYRYAIKKRFKQMEYRLSIGPITP